MRISRGDYWPISAILCVCAVVIAVWFTYMDRYVRYPLDCYLFLEMAKNFATTGTPYVSFEQGYPIHHFQGYPVVLGLFSLFWGPDSAWLPLQAILLPACCFLIYTGARRLEASVNVASMAACLFAANCVVVRWGGLPMSELLALLFTLAAANILFSHLSPWGKSLLGGACLAAALLVRPHMAFYVPLAGLYLWLPTRSRAGFVRSVVLALLSILPSVVYALMKRSTTGHLLPYATEAAEQMRPAFAGDYFFVSLAKMFRQPNVVHPMTWVNLSAILTHWFFAAALFVGARGFLGRNAKGAAWIVLLYLFMLSFYFYSTERYNLVIMPCSTFLFASMLEWYVGRVKSQAVWTCVCAYICITQILFGTAMIEDHRNALAVGAGRGKQLAAIANARPQHAWSEMGPEFAYYFRGKTYFDFEDINFFRQTHTPAQYFGKFPVSWVISRQAPNEWFRSHPDVSSSTLALRRRTSDGVFTLYEVMKADGAR